MNQTAEKPTPHFDTSKYYKHPEYGFVYGLDVKTPLGDLYWPFLKEPKKAPEPKPGQQKSKDKYLITWAGNKEDVKVKAFLEELNLMVQSMLPLFNEGRGAEVTFKSIVQDGDVVAAKNEKTDYFKGKWLIQANNPKDDFFLRGPEKQEFTVDQVMGGMRGVVILQPYITSHGVRYKLKVIQVKEDDGTRVANPQTRETVLGLLDDEDDGGAPEGDTSSPVAAGDSKEVVAEKAKGRKAAVDLL